MAAAGTDDMMLGGWIVLIVEDDPDHRLLMERVLNDAGAETLTARTGTEALAVAGHADVALIDINLPDRSGVEILGAVRALGAQVIVVTGGGSEDSAIAALREGASDYIVKNPGYLRALPPLVARAVAETHRRDREVAAVRELKAVAEARRQFLDAIAHDLRTPLTCITGFVQTLHSRWDEISDDERHNMLERVLHHTAALRGLVDHVLDNIEEDPPSVADLDDVLGRPGLPSSDADAVIPDNVEA